MRRIWLPLVAVLGVLAIGGLPALALGLAARDAGVSSSAGQPAPVASATPSPDRTVAPRVRGNGPRVDASPGAPLVVPPGIVPLDRSHQRCLVAFTRIWRERAAQTDPPALTPAQRARLMGACDGLAERMLQRMERRMDRYRDTARDQSLSR